MSIKFNPTNKHVICNMPGIGVNERHAAISYDESKHEYYLEPFANSRVVQNGRVCSDECRGELRNFDRLVFGASLYYLFVDPARFGPSSEETMAKVNNFTVERVQQEIAEQAGLIGSQFEKNRRPDEIACINELIDLMPLVEEANQLSIMMDRKVKYEALILNPIVIGDTYSKPKVCDFQFLSGRKFYLISLFLIACCSCEKVWYF